MKKGWRIALKVIDALVWLWNKIKPSIEKDVEPGETPKLK